jgi:hypothetical protein
MSKVRVEATDLLRLLKREREVFDIISLDFHGPFAFDKLEIYRHLRPAATHYLLVNLEAAREQPLGKYMLRERFENHRDPRHGFERAVELAGGPRASVSADEVEERIDGHDLWDAREERADVVRGLGAGQWTETSALAPLLRRFEACFAAQGPVLGYRYPHTVTPQVELDNLATRTCAVLGRVAHSAMRLGVQCPDYTSSQLAYELYLEYQDAVYAPAIIADVRRYAYRSAASKVGQTYLSSFSEQRPPPKYTPETRAVAEFIVEHCIRYRELARTDGSGAARGGIECLPVMSRSGSHLFQGFRVDAGPGRTREGPVLSSATLLKAINTRRQRNLPLALREEELLNRPRTLL